MSHNYYVYILTNGPNGVLYIGVSNDLNRRIYEHKNEIYSGFTKEYHLHKLVYFELFFNVTDAIKREKQLKMWKRRWKIGLIENINPTWMDLTTVDVIESKKEILPLRMESEKKE